MELKPDELPSSPTRHSDLRQRVWRSEKWHRRQQHNQLPMDGREIMMRTGLTAKEMMRHRDRGLLPYIKNMAGLKKDVNFYTPKGIEAFIHKEGYDAILEKRYSQPQGTGTDVPANSGEGSEDTTEGTRS